MLSKRNYMLSDSGNSTENGKYLRLFWVAGCGLRAALDAGRQGPGPACKAYREPALLIARERLRSNT